MQQVQWPTQIVSVQRNKREKKLKIIYFKKVPTRIQQYDNENEKTKGKYGHIQEKVYDIMCRLVCKTRPKGDRG